MIVVFVFFFSFLFFGVICYVINSESYLQRTFNEELQKAKKNRKYHD